VSKDQAAVVGAKAYDAEYYRRWYHDPGRRVIKPAAVARKVRLVTGIAEALLERPIRSVLDVGCGEGAWRGHLRRLRPRVRYVGVESSAYAVERFGRSRGIVRGSFGTLASLGLEGPFDLVVVCDVLHYVPEGELGPGLAAVTDLLGGVAYLEAYTTADEIEGDRGAWHHRSPEQYRRHFRRARLHAVGMHCYVGPDLAGATAALERGQV
jgi:SAM-dependent methyltransferase